MYRIVDTPDLVRRILSQFAPTWSAELEEEWVRFLWNHAGFREVQVFVDKGADCIAQRGYRNNFVYDQRTGLVFFDLAGSSHQLLMAYLQALHETTFPEDDEDWFGRHFKAYNAESDLADRYLEQGHGILLSSVGHRNAVYVGQAFVWTDSERQAFHGYRLEEL